MCAPVVDLELLSVELCSLVCDGRLLQIMLVRVLVSLDVEVQTLW